MTTFSPASRNHGARRFLASRLVGCRLTNQKDAAVGTLEDLVFDGSNRRIAYAVVSFGGVLGLGSKFFAMPWQLIEVAELEAGQSLHATMNIARETLLAAPGFDKLNWPEVADARWAARLDTHYRPGDAGRSPARFDEHGRRLIDIGHDVERPATEQDLAHRRLSQVLGMDVVDARQRALASVEDLILDVGRATVDGVVLAIGGMIGSSDRVVLVPADALHFDPEEDVFVLASSFARLETMATSRAVWPPLDSDDWLLAGRERLAIGRDAAALPEKAAPADERPPKAVPPAA